MSKRRRTSQLAAFGAATEDDASLLQPSHFPSATGLSTRDTSHRGVIPPLTTFAARRFVAHIQTISQNERSWARSKRYLKCLPETLVPRLFSMLRSSCPTLLSHGFIVLYFLRGPSLVLSSNLPGVQRQTITFIPNNASLRELHLIGFDKFTDTVFASILPSLPQLRVLVLRGCAKVGTQTAQAIGSTCRSLTTLNLSYTSVTPISLLGPLTSCTHLQVLKVAGIPNWTDSTFAKLVIGLDNTFPRMINLKFRQLALSELSIQAFVSYCPNLTRLDVSFTRLQRLSPTMVIPPPPLEKLSLTSTSLSGPGLLLLISVFPNLKTLYLGAIGNGQGSSSLTSDMTLTDEMLMSLTDILETFPLLEKFSLVGNTKLGLFCKRGHNALGDVISRVGRRCKYLNLSGIPHLRSNDLSSLIPKTEQDDPPRLEELVLNNTGIDDDVAPFLACCSSLRVLEVAGTKLTSHGLFPVIDNCPNLCKLDLTSCRGIKVADRRRFFEIWERERERN